MVFAGRSRAGCRSAPAMLALAGHDRATRIGVVHARQRNISAETGCTGYVQCISGGSSGDNLVGSGREVSIAQGGPLHPRCFLNTRRHRRTSCLFLNALKNLRVKFGNAYDEFPEEGIAPSKPRAGVFAGVMSIE